MKKTAQTLCLVLLLGIIPSTIYSQSFYMSFGGGYGIGVNGLRTSSYSTSYTYKLDTNYAHSTYFSNKVTLGNGFIPSIGVGIMFNKNIGFDINTAYLFGKPYEYSQTDNYDFPYGNYRSFAINQSTSGNSIIILPSIILKSHLDKSVDYFLKVGLAIGSTRIDELNDIRIIDGFSGSKSPFININYTREFSSSFSLGMQISAGIEIFLLENLNFYAQCSYLGYSTTPKSSEIVSYSYEGEDKLSDLTTKEKETIYVETYTEDDPISDDEPNKSLYNTYSFNMIHIEIGLLWSFGNTE